MVKNNNRKRVLILGGYSVLGTHIARLLSADPNLQLTIAGRDKLRAEFCASKLPGPAESLHLDWDATDLPAQLKALSPDLLIHCAGPFCSEPDYQVARACIESRTPYLDIANARRFVCDFRRLSAEANAAGIPMISGAGLCPALSSAVLKEIRRELPLIHTVNIAVAPANDNELAPAAPIGEPFPQLQDGLWRETFTGNRLRRISLAHPVGKRWLFDADVPDLELCVQWIPELRSVWFATGVESRITQIGSALCAHLMQMNFPTPGRGLSLNLARYRARTNGHSGILIRAEGKDTRDAPAGIQWQMLGLNGQGPWMAAAPAAVMARKLLHKGSEFIGASACWQLLDLEEILAELTPYPIVTATERLEL
ncbi:saccharopine dehydrogenase NADP-binding domain-containing protein [Microbulbifer thermotolerans]|uniref:Saccharopine dehydrogenase NADP-binding domain-containing protein n=1 Tax=Microbulbifer thermotolerans TaxID=252514 RepID=A0AB35HYT3_MICTH|nr:saccharopine dehydrogenase NADP-binding domain-containing protein [Microbulbifer thermotolerans]MCX2782503.1 saccharopine dehydrogenase NADP-binding domain-containing protein [Microbulbifer thermotolerans]MCX2794515.1 saccharopine dehydrogenase NADP-binding domain-containing protein [Microbulbifer thermotolerans]MCX2802208.1 saccharopine dehydrogenase NADP-binding domain-containing protein [Microbulbifer thermotolerans]